MDGLDGLDRGSSSRPNTPFGGRLGRHVCSTFRVEIIDLDAGRRAGNLFTLAFHIETGPWTGWDEVWHRMGRGRDVTGREEGTDIDACHIAHCYTHTRHVATAV